MLTIAGNAKRHNVYLRPIKSVIQPKKIAPTKPPIPINEATHDNCSVVSALSRGVSFSDFNIKKLDDGHPADVPYDIDIKFTLKQRTH